MTTHIDVGKLVGAASAPVALIIAASICLGNVGAKHAMIIGLFRECTKEYRTITDRDSIRCRSLERQIEHYSSRLRLLMRGTLWVTLAIQSFILTVICTSIGVIFSKQPIWTGVTGFFSFAGFLLLGGFGVVEIMENQRAKQSLMLETAEFPNVLASKSSEESKASFVGTSNH